MGLANDFLQQARQLAGMPGRPSQINLRRSTSAAYYALFHLLIHEAVWAAVPPAPRPLRGRACRAMQHGEMREVCKHFKQTSGKALQWIGNTPSTDLRSIAEAFLDLQDERHTADYDVSARLSVRAAQTNVQKAQDAFAAWSRVRGTAEGKTFLAALIFAKRWDR